MMQLIHLFLREKWNVTFVSPAQQTQHAEKLDKIGVQTRNIYPNDEKTDKYLQKLQPDIVLFDRFMIEEQFGWRVAEFCPDALRVLDTEDLHFLRKARQEALKQNKSFDHLQSDSILAKREIAAILRCDLSLIISEAEINILKNHFQIDPNILWYLPFLMPPVETDSFLKLPSFSARKDMMFIGNFLHAPNYDAVLYLKNKIWPLIHRKDSSVKMQIYGAYASQKVQQLENRQQNFIVNGRAEDLRETFQKSRILLAPLRFGAGLKGKFFDAMQNGTASVTTNIGIEGICSAAEFNGKVAETPEKIAELSLNLYYNQAEWEKAQKKGSKIIQSRFLLSKFDDLFLEQLNRLTKELKRHRQQNFMGQMLMHHRQQSTKYMSRWIELKNKYAR